MNKLNRSLTTNPPCQKCNDNGFYYVHGIISDPVIFNCECNPDKLNLSENKGMNHPAESAHVKDKF